MLALGRARRGTQRRSAVPAARRRSGYVYFLETRGRGVFLRASPIDVSAIVRELLLDRHGRDRADVGDADRRRRVRLRARPARRPPGATELRARLRVRLRAPGDPLSAEEDARPAIAGVRRRPRRARSSRSSSGRAGRAFVLFTSYANLREVHQLAAAELEYPILVQGTAPRSALLRDFKATPNAVLLATSSFWQGVDVVGEALSCVIIDKLPFASPGDPITAARIEAISARGGSAVRRVPDAAGDPGAQQGLGRLLRHRQDRGVLAVLDPRLQTWATGGGSWRRCRRRRSRTTSSTSRASSARHRSSMPDDASRQREPARPADPEVGGRQAAAPADAAALLSGAFNRYVEPFLGSGAVFLDCHNGACSTAATSGCRTSTPTSSAAIGWCATRSRRSSTRSTRSRPDTTPAARGISTPSATTQFNPHAAGRPRLSDPARAYTPALAAMLIYLNRTGYNGLFRLNSRGGFNVPAGRYNEGHHLRRAEPPRLSSALRRPGPDARGPPLRRALADGRPDDFVYLDPPYAPVSRTAQFTSYTAARFGPRGASCGCSGPSSGSRGTGRPVLLSNSVAPEIRQLYADQRRRAGRRA